MLPTTALSLRIICFFIRFPLLNKTDAVIMWLRAPVSACTSERWQDSTCPHVQDAA